MAIENVINGITITCHDEGLDDVRNPARVVITNQKGEKVATVYVVKGLITGADGGIYTCIKFELAPKK